MTEDLTITLDGEDYVLRPEGDGIRMGRRVDGDVTWLETVAGSLLPASAREALDRGDTSDEALVTALRGVLQADVERGG